MADFQVVLETYRNQFKTIRDTLKDIVEKLPENVDNAKSSLTNAQRKTDEWINMTIVNTKIHGTDTTPIGAHHNLFRAIMETYMWVSLCLLNSSLAFLVGSGSLYHPINYFFNKPVVFLISFVVLPLATYLYLRKTEMADDERRTVLLFSTVVRCVFAGFLLDSCYLAFYPPPAFVTPLILGLTAGFSNDSLETQPRTVYLAISVAPSFVFYVLFGYLTGSFGLAYLIWSVAYCLLIVIDFQTKLGSIWTNGIGVASDDIVTITWFILSEVTFTILFSSSPE